MAHATGLRLMAGFGFLTVIGSPIGYLLWRKARQKEKEREKELELLEQAAEG